MTYTPTPLVEVAFGFGPYDEPTGSDWIDVTEYVFEVTVERGRSSEFSEFPASTATVVLNNDDRRFDPLNAAGPHYGELLANVPIRITAEVDSTTYPVWRGVVDGWPAVYHEGGYRSEVEVACTDVFKLLAERPLPDTHDLFLDEWAPGQPDRWYKMDDAPNGVLPDSGTNPHDLTVYQSVAKADPIVATSTGALSIPEMTPPTSQYLTAIEGRVINPATDDPTYHTNWTVALSFIVNEGWRGFFSTVNSAGPLGGGVVVTFYCGSLGELVGIVQYSAPSGYLTVQSDGAYNDGVVHQAVLTRGNNVLALYVDGLLVDSDIDAAALGSLVWIGNGTVRMGYTALGPTPASATTMDEVMVWTGHYMTQSEVTALYEEQRIGFGTTQQSGAAITKVLDLIDWPASLRNIDSGEAQITLPATPQGYTALGLLQTITDSEGGRLFIDQQGRITFHDRGHDFRESTGNSNQYTFSDVDQDDRVPPSIGILDETLRVTLDDSFVFEAAAITRAGGNVRTASSSSTPARTFKRDGLLFQSDLEAASLAQWIVFRYSTPVARSDAWEVDPEVKPDDWPDILNLEVGHRIKHDVTPAGLGSSLQLEQHVELIEHEISPEQWIVTLNGSPVDPNDYFIWAATETADDDHGWADTDQNPPGGAWG